MGKNCDIFISYKRSDGTILAKLFRNLLEEQGYRVFLDLKELHRGRFDLQLQEHLHSCCDVICVLTSDYIQALCQEPGEQNWVGLELQQALQAHPAKNIIPITIGSVRMPARAELAPEVKSVVAYEAVHYNPEGTHEEELAFLRRLSGMLTSAPQKVDYLKHVTLSDYSSTYKPEQKRLLLQQQYSQQIDDEAFQWAISHMPRREGLIGLDLGCADGTVTRLRFDRFDQFHRVIGIDKNSDAIASARRDEKYAFYAINAEESDFEERLEQALAELGADQVDLVFSALTVHHMTHPIRALERLRRYVRPGGAIILRGVDDGTLVAFGDDGLAERCVELSLQAENMSDRYHGRKFYSQLLQAGFCDVKMLFTTDCTVGMDDDERDELYRYYFNFRKNYTAKLVNAHPGDHRISELDTAMRTALSKLRDRFEDPGLFVMITNLAAVGFAP